MAPIRMASPGPVLGRDWLTFSVVLVTVAGSLICTVLPYTLVNNRSNEPGLPGGCGVWGMGFLILTLNVFVIDCFGLMVTGLFHARVWVSWSKVAPSSELKSRSAYSRISANSSGLSRVFLESPSPKFLVVREYSIISPPRAVELFASEMFWVRFLAFFSIASNGDFSAGFSGFFGSSFGFSGVLGSSHLPSEFRVVFGGQSIFISLQTVDFSVL